MSVTWIPFRFPDLPSVGCAFQTRVGGASTGDWGGGNISFVTGDNRTAVLANRRDLLAQLGLAGLAELSQVHGDALVFEPDPVPADALPTHEADGHATTLPGLGLVIKTADCQPLLLTHREGKHIAALHVGWRGNRVNFPASAVQQFCAYYDLLPRHLLAVRGPSLGPDMAEFVNFDAEWGTDFAAWFDAHQRTMDLWSLTRSQLA